MKKLLEYLKRKNQEPIYWDRLFLIVFANIMIAMGIIAVFDLHSIEGACFGFSVGIVAHVHYWRGGRFLMDVAKGGKQ